MKSKVCKFIAVSAFAICLSLSSTTVSKIVCDADNPIIDVNYMISCDLPVQHLG